jgi:hypothetical protein
MGCPLLWGVMLHGLVASCGRFGNTYRSLLQVHSRWDPVGVPSTSPTTNLRCTTSQKSENIAPRQKPENTHRYNNAPQTKLFTKTFALYTINIPLIWGPR